MPGFVMTRSPKPVARRNRTGRKLKASDDRSRKKDRNAIAREKFLAKYRKVENV